MKNNDKFESLITPVTVIKEDVQNNINSNVIIREFNKSTKKLSNEYNGKISGVYRNLFTVDVKENNLIQKKSIMYSDVSIGLVEYSLCK